MKKGGLEMSKSIYKKLLEIRKAVPYIQKLKQGYQYSYVSSSDVLGAVRRKMDEVGILLFPKIKEVKTKVFSTEYRDDKGNTRIQNTYFTELFIDFEWVCVDTGESLTVPFYAQGIDTGGEKGVGKALTYAEKYFLLKQFNIPTDEDDPDLFQQKTEHFIPNYIKDDQIEELNKMLNELSQITNSPVSNYFSALGITSVETIRSEQYLKIRKQVQKWLDIAKQKNNQPTQDQPVQQQSAQEERPTQQSTQPQQQTQQNMEQQSQQSAEMQQQPQTPPQNLYVLEKKEFITTPSGELAGKLFVQGNEQVIFARTPEIVEKLKEISEGETFEATIQEKNGFLFMTAARKMEAPA